MSDGEAELSPSQILERVKPDRVTITKPEEDRRRRTIIVEKKNGSYGFTLQSYGIHYKKEQEIEMITYVDYVDYDGPAYRAGMREGDVILSINGHDMEKSDHKTLVNFIKKCDTRMRMVVLFEDCVRKVELHMRYIKLQRVLQAKMVELERLCLKERELLQGKWKTHSLPARKKASGGKSSDVMTPTKSDPDEISYCRPTVSTEDVAKAQSHASVYPQQPHFLLAYQYQYFDSQGRAYVLQPTAHNSGEFLVSTWQSNSNYSTSERDRQRSTSQTSRYRDRDREGDYRQHHYVIEVGAGSSGSRRCSNSSIHPETSRGYHQSNGMAAASTTSSNHKSSKGHSSNNRAERSHHHHLCNPCMQPSPQDNTSLEAYDLASPCCNSHCVPSSRRRSRHHNKSIQESSKEERSRQKEYKEKSNSRSVQVSSDAYHPTSDRQGHHHSTNGSAHRHHHNASNQTPYNGRGTRYLSLVSQCSLHSCTSSELNSGGVAVASNVAGESSAASYTTSLSTDTLYWDPPNECNNTRHHSVKSTSSSQRHNDTAKPKSWDNLTTKSFGGYGFGYGYLDRGEVKGHANSAKSGHSGSSHRRRYVQPTKSTESLLLLPRYPILSDSSLSCECLDTSSPTLVTEQNGKFFAVNGEQFYHRDKASQTESRRIVNIQQAPEITRL
uniref:PDZ domain-containing protein n=2 Tax=Clastoptera arizonana TaxID=38151 RepID=A0A1B6DC19_9HEMI